MFTIIFDMDGVISDTQKVHSQIESDLLKSSGVFITPDEITQRFAGVRTADFFIDLLKHKNCDVNTLLARKWLLMRESVAEHVESIDGAINLIKTLHAQGRKLAIASASNSDYVHTVLHTLHVHDYFGAIISGDMVSNGKPDPEIFLLAAKKLGAQPNECVVIEDGISGMTAACTAGMHCIGLVSDLADQVPATVKITSMHNALDVLMLIEMSASAESRLLI